MVSITKYPTIKLFLILFNTFLLIISFSCYDRTSVNKNNIEDILKILPKNHSGKSIILVGVDGASWNVINTMLTKHELPNFKKIIENGASAEMKSLVPIISPPIWTSIACGYTPDIHGINHWFYKDADNHLKLFASESIQCKMIWDYFGSNGLVSGVCGWLLTWPAFKINGFMISRVSHLSLKGNPDPEGPAPIQGSFLTFDPSFSYPSNLLNFFASKIVKKEDIKPDIISRFFSSPTDKSTKNMESSLNIFKFAYAGDLTYFQLGAELLRLNHPDLFMIYFCGIDAVCHQYWKYFEKQNFPFLPEAEIKIYENVIPEYYRFIDKILGNILYLMNEDDILLVVSDHGFESNLDYNLKFLSSGKHNANGIFMAFGKEISKGKKLAEISILDITPTLLYLAGIPLALDMKGAPVKEILQTNYKNSDEIKWIPTYLDSTFETKTRIPEKQTPPDFNEIINYLRSLGYVQ